MLKPLACLRAGESWCIVQSNRSSGRPSFTGLDRAKVVIAAVVGAVIGLPVALLLNEEVVNGAKTVAAGACLAALLAALVIERRLRKEVRRPLMGWYVQVYPIAGQLPAGQHVDFWVHGFVGEKQPSEGEAIRAAVDSYAKSNNGDRRVRSCAERSRHERRGETKVYEIVWEPT